MSDYCIWKVIRSYMHFISKSLTNFYNIFHQLVNKTILESLLIQISFAKIDLNESILMNIIFNHWNFSSMDVLHWKIDYVIPFGEYLDLSVIVVFCKSMYNGNLNIPQVITTENW